MFCTNCGYNFEGATICPMCGTTIEQEVPVSTQDSQAYQPLAQESYQIQPMQTQLVNDGSNSGEDQPEKSNLKRLLLITIPALILVIAIIFGVVFVAFTSNPKLKVLKALEKTFFEMSAFNFEFNVDDYYSYRGSVAYGDNLSKSSFFFSAKDDYNDYTIVSNEGMVLAGWDYGYDEDNVKLFIAASDIYNEIIESPKKLSVFDDLFDEMEIDQVDAFEFTQNIILNGKINENALKEIYNIWLRELIADELDERTSVVPDYDTIKKLFIDFIVKGSTEESIDVKRLNKSNGTTYYDVTINAGEFYRELFEFLKKSKNAEEFLSTEFGEYFLETLEDEAEWCDGEEESFMVGISGDYLTEFIVETDDVEIELILSEINEKSTNYEELYNDVEEEFEDAYNELKIKKVKDIERIFF